MHFRLEGAPSRKIASGFSLLELVLVAGVGAVVFTAGALALRVVAKNQRVAGAFQEVALPAGVGANFYPGSGLTATDSYTAPNFGRCSQADVMRTMFLEEIEKSVAVFVLPRAGNLNTIRGRTLELRGVLPQSLDTPKAFLAYLLSNPDTATAAQVFSSYRGAPSDSVSVTVTDPVTGTTSTSTGFVTNASIFILQPSGSNGQIWIRSVYEIDYVGLPVNASNPAAPDVPCVFASVRRYVSNTLTHYFDVVYREAALSDVGIPCAHFERAARRKLAESNSIQMFKMAANQPFYLLWWPDPAVQRLKGTVSDPPYDAATPQSTYAKHEGQTSYVFVIPQFPAL